MKSITILFAAALILIGFGPQAYAKPKIAILGLEVIEKGGVDQKTTQAAQDFAQQLRVEAAKSNGKFSLAPNSAQDLLELKLLSGCSNEGRTCMADIGKELGADRLLYGKLERRKKGYQISLNLLNTNTREMERTTTELIPAKDLSKKNGKWAATLYSRLIGIPEAGSLVINANIDRATIYIDGNVATTLRDGSAKVLGLNAGVHKISIEADGYERYKAEVAIDAGETENLSVSLQLIEVYQDKPKGKTDGDGGSGTGWKVAFVGGVLVTGGMAAGWTYNGLQVWGDLDKDKVSAWNDLNGRKTDISTETGEPERILNDLANDCSKAKGLTAPSGNPDLYGDLIAACDAGQDKAALVNLFIAGTAVAAIATIYFGYQGWVVHGDKKERMSKGKRKKENRIVVTPQLTHESVGAGLSLEF